MYKQNRTGMESEDQNSAYINSQIINSMNQEICKNSKWKQHVLTARDNLRMES